MMRSLQEIILALKNLKGITTDAELAQLLGMKAKTLAATKVRDSIPFSELITFCLQNEISLDWLFSGEGEAARLKGARYDPVLMQTIIEVTEASFDEIKIFMPPERKAKFIDHLYELLYNDKKATQLTTEELKKVTRDHILKLAEITGLRRK